MSLSCCTVSPLIIIIPYHGAVLKRTRSLSLSLSVLFLLIQNAEQWMVHQLIVKLLELFEGVLEVLTGALRQNVHLKVRVRHLLLVVLLVWRRVLLTLAL